ncbi:archease [Fodinibius sediminis]|uniref:SHS2 domain-containing protein n=1 Tax=Fodinibius sediminis TaxID=1214077 RepID=A0A521BPM1_9BACT|nr:archease [Fodinibius sediminis]SMO49112.1 SHS2 domain-containing protein [Fodinibius sediminis]
MSETTEFLTHTADVKVRVTAETLPGLFRLGLRVLNQLLVPDINHREGDLTIVKNINIQSSDLTALIIDFLSEVLTLSQIYKAVFIEVEIHEMSRCRLSGVLKGMEVNAFQEDIKAVTYHEAKVRVNEKGEWETIIIFDI